MEEVKRTVEEVMGYRASDGTFFRHKDACVEYEQSARYAARCAAKALRINGADLERIIPKKMLGCWEEFIEVYDISNPDYLVVLNTHLKLINSRCEIVDPKYIGHKVAIQYWVDDDSYNVLGTLDEIIDEFKANINKLFEPEVE